MQRFVAYQLDRQMKRLLERQQKRIVVNSVDELKCTKIAVE